MIDPLSISLIVAAFIIVAIISFIMGNVFGQDEGAQKYLEQLNFWRSQSMESGQELHKLGKVKKAYAPYKNPEDGRWHCPRTGEYVDEQDIIPEIR